MLKKILYQNWKMKRDGEEQDIPALVPGSVYYDLLNHGRMEEPYYRDNEMKALSLMEYDYRYSTEFSVEDEYFQMDEVLLRLEGIDTVAEIWLNGLLLERICNMHRTWDYSVKSLLRKEENLLEVVLKSPTKYIKEMYEKDKMDGMADAMQGFPHIRKAHYMFGWDWGGRFPDAGIFRNVKLLGIRKASFTGCYVTQEHGEKGVSLHVSSKIREAEKAQEVELIHSQQAFEPALSKRRGGVCEDNGYSILVSVMGPDGEVLYKDNKNPDSLPIEEPQLWWPNGYGEQPLYTVKVRLMYEDILCDEWERRIGLRTMTMHIEKDEFGEQFAHMVNGVKIFAMGADYIPEDNILKRVTKERTKKLLEHCKDSHFNCIRVWGGGYYCEDFFYDICDELGIIVWQDFMFACAVYHLTKEFEDNITAEIIDNVRRIRHHACLGLWCGNNEMESFVLTGTWGTENSIKADYIKMYEYIFPRILKEEDPQTFYWPSSPSSGGSFDNPGDDTRGDNHYWDVWHDNKPFTEFRKFKFRYLSEFGFQSFPSVETIKSFTLPEDRNAFSYVMEKHQRNAAANGKIMSYMEQTYLYPTSLDAMVYGSQLLQAEAIRYGVEHFRRYRGRCMGTLYWQLNDCWPVASWASIDYYGRWKALQYYAKRFFAPLMISCEEEGMLSQGNNVNKEPFELEKSVRLNVANETMEEHKVTVKWQLRNNKAEILRQEETFLAVSALSAVWIEKKELPEADIYHQYVSYQMEEDEEIVSEGTVLFCPPKYFNFEEPQLTVEVQGGEIVVIAYAYAKSIEIRNDKDDMILSDNFFDMNAGEKRVKILSGKPDGIRVRSVFDIR